MSKQTLFEVSNLSGVATDGLKDYIQFRRSLQEKCNRSSKEWRGHEDAIQRATAELDRRQKF